MLLKLAINFNLKSVHQSLNLLISRCSSTKSSLIKTKTISKNISFRYLSPDNSAYQQENLNPQKPLIILLSWLQSKESNLDKYRQIYLKKGFDVLTVKTFPLQILFPTYGSQLIADDLLNYLAINQNYQKILIHGFSVGAYQFSETMVKLKTGLIDEKSRSKSLSIKNRIKGVIFDSAVDYDMVPYGVSRALLGETKSANFLENLIRIYLKLSFYVATKHYLKATQTFTDTPLRCPHLLIVSKADKLGNYTPNQAAANYWGEELKIDVKLKCFESSKHVKHYQTYKEEYLKLIDEFLLKIEI